MTNINLGKALLLTGMLLLTRSEVFAEFYLQPSLTLREEYNDNIYLEEDDQEDDFITSITPGNQLGLENRRRRPDPRLRPGLQILLEQHQRG